MSVRENIFRKWATFTPFKNKNNKDVKNTET